MAQGPAAPKETVPDHGLQMRHSAPSTNLRHATDGLLAQEESPVLTGGTGPGGQTLYCPPVPVHGYADNPVQNHNASQRSEI